MKEYSPNICFSIFDERGFLGALSIHNDEPTNLYCGELYNEAMRVIKDILYHYNKEIVAEKDSLPRPIYALRTLERCGLNPHSGALVPGKSKATEDILLPYKSKYDLSHSCFSINMITLDPKEEIEWKSKYILKVIINLKEKSIVFDHFVRCFDVLGYCEQFDKPEEDFWEFMNEATYYPSSHSEYTLSSFSFNYLDEVEELVRENREGFKDNVIDCIVRLR